MIFEMNNIIILQFTNSFEFTKRFLGYHMKIHKISNNGSWDTWNSYFQAASKIWKQRKKIVSRS